MADPRTVLAEHGIDVPANMNVNVVENTDNTVHITMPQAPAGDGELSDEELDKVAGGGGCKCHECDAIHSQATMAFTMQA
ncbi:MAG: mersacidin/lichenicidin family type 2 lantibiotic [Phycisphaerales bacterium]|nr:mersacidin/lichenicidin family type 2 lantibiotic [Phycisphaerales bacterium]